MKLPAILTACILLMPFSVSAQDNDDDIKALEEATAKEYVEKFNGIIKSGTLDPPADQGDGKPDSLERRLWSAGYYSAVVELLEPAKAREARDPGLVYPFGRGVGIHRSFGYIAGQRAACEMARELFMSIYTRRLGELDARLAAREKSKKPSKPARGDEKQTGDESEPSC